MAREHAVRREFPGRTFAPLILAGLSICTSAGADTVLERAAASFRRELMVESFGVFWIAAEVVILFCMGVAVRVFAQRPLPERIRLTEPEVRRAWLWGIATALLALFVFGRHAFIAPLPGAFESIAESGVDVVQRARAASQFRASVHLTLWCVLIVAWMILEIAIVAQGVRAYRQLRALIQENRRAA